MIYINKKTGAIIDSPCKLGGGDWIKEGEQQEEVSSTVEAPEASEPVAAPDVEIDLSSFTVEQLQAYAKEKGIELGKASKKADIIEVILEAQ